MAGKPSDLQLTASDSTDQLSESAPAHVREVAGATFRADEGLGELQVSTGILCPTLPYRLWNGVSKDQAALAKHITVEHTHDAGKSYLHLIQGRDKAELEYKKAED